jgi:tetratricopeptide (TPR) repeat protein
MVLTSAILFLICLSKIRLTNKFLILISVIGIIVCLSLPNYKDVLQTIKISETVSQKRSLSNRITSLSFIKPALKENPFLGVGTGNYSLSVNKYMFEDDNNNFTNFAPNIFSQIILEKGMIGISLWMIFVMSFLIMFFKNKKPEPNNKIQLCILLFLFVILIREISFPSYFRSSNIQLTVAVFIAIFVNSNQSPILSLKKYQICFPGLIIILFTISIGFYLIFENDRKNFDLFLSALKIENFDEAETCLKKTRKITPTHIYLANLNWKKFLKYNEIKYLENANKCLENAISSNSNDIRLQHDRAIILYFMKKYDECKNILANLAESFPDNTLYQLSFGKFLYVNGEKELSSKYFAKAMELTPSILEKFKIDLFSTIDIATTEYITKNIQYDISSMPDDPILLAKYGKLHYCLGNFSLAKRYLSQAVKTLPNLELPWYYLQMIAFRENDAEQYHDLVKKVKLFGTQIPSTEFANNINWFSNYYIKFQTWYNANWDLELLDINWNVK